MDLQLNPGARYFPAQLVGVPITEVAPIGREYWTISLPPQNTPFGPDALCPEADTELRRMTNRTDVLTPDITSILRQRHSPKTDLQTEKTRIGLHVDSGDLFSDVEAY